MLYATYGSFKRSDLKEDLIQGEVPDTLYGYQRADG